MNEVDLQHQDYRIDLVALAPERNIRRRYAIAASRDLFGHVIVELSWGRIGTRGQQQRMSFERHDAAARFVARTLRRRSSAKARLGVDYVFIPQATPGSAVATACAG
jgi:predicted DNA-binding WGR domain protein